MHLQPLVLPTIQILNKAEAEKQITTINDLFFKISQGP